MYEIISRLIEQVNKYNFNMSKDFINWLTEQLNERGWSNSELSRRSGMATSTISMIFSEQSRPGWDFCLAIASAFNEPPEKVFRLAGLLPSLSGSEDEQTLKEILDIAKNMTSENRQDLLNYARYRYQQQEGKKRR